jgi:hypothetical protein
MTIKRFSLPTMLHSVAMPHADSDPPKERLGEGACISAKLEQAINANSRGLGYGG